MTVGLKSIRKLADWKVVLASPLPVLVDFTASWCGPCRMLKPILEKFAAEHIDTLRVVSLDVDKLPGVADSNRIRSVPTLMLFRDGKKIGRRIPGVVSPSELRVRVAALLAEK